MLVLEISPYDFLLDDEAVNVMANDTGKRQVSTLTIEYDEAQT